MAGSVLFHAVWVIRPLADHGVPRSWWPWLGTAKAAGAAGLVVGLFVPVIGVLAGAGLVLYFAGAVVTGPCAVVLPRRVPADVHGAGGRFPGAGVRRLSRAHRPPATSARAAATVSGSDSRTGTAWRRAT